MIYQLYEYSYTKRKYILVDTFDSYDYAEAYAESKCEKGMWYIAEKY